MNNWYNYDTFAIAMTLGVLAEKGVLSLRDVLFICLVSIGLSAAASFMSGFWNAIATNKTTQRK